LFLHENNGKKEFQFTTNIILVCKFSNLQTHTYIYLFTLSKFGHSYFPVMQNNYWCIRCSKCRFSLVETKILFMVINTSVSIP